MTDLGATPATATAALEHLPLGVVIVPAVPTSDAPWANAAARALAPSDEGLQRLVEAVGASPAVAESRVRKASTSAVIALPTHRGIVEREIWAAPLGDGSDATVATFHADFDVRAAGTAAAELVGRLEAMLEHTVDMITVLDAEGNILFSNAAAGVLTGFTGEGVSGRAAFDFIHPDDLDRAAKAFAAALAAPGRSPVVELRVRFADGTWHDVDVVVNNLLHVPSVGGLVVALHDVTDRRAAEREAAAGEARMRSWVENLSDVIVVLDAGYAVTYASPAISRIIDAPPETNVGLSAFSDMHPDDLQDAVDALTKLSASPVGTMTRIDLRLETRPGSGHWRWVEATAVNRLPDPAVAGIVCTLRDVTEQREAAEELQAALERERAAGERLRDLDRLKDDFLATVSHELRTPLSVIVGFSDLLRRNDLEPALAAEAIDRIRACAADMRGMVENLLAFSALEAGQVTVRPVALDVAAAVEGAIVRLRPMLGEHELVVDVAANLVVRADPEGFEAVVRNLVTNAAKYSEAGSQIALRAWRDDGSVVVEVEDHGPGIAPEQLDLVFERLYRAPGAAFAGRGTGVGLNTARRYAELMGGRLTARSYPGRGSTFAVALPEG